jgi:hypothetical protein
MTGCAAIAERTSTNEKSSAIALSVFDVTVVAGMVCSESNCYRNECALEIFQRQS